MSSVSPRSWAIASLLVLGGFLLGLGISLVSFQYSAQIASLPSGFSKTPLPDREITSEKLMVNRIIDGDTIELENKKRVRYIGIDTPESVDPRKPVQCFAREAAQRNTQLVLGKSVRLEKDVSEVDRYGRLLRYVYIQTPDGQEEMVNMILVREGFASAASFPPDIKYQDSFREAQRLARTEKRGLWESCPIPRSSISPISTPSSIGANGAAKNEVRTQSAPGSCSIKGNISSGGKIYHLPGCGSYDKTSIDESAGERWFCSEQEAIAAGWRKAKNC